MLTPSPGFLFQDHSFKGVMPVVVGVKGMLRRAQSSVRLVVRTKQEGVRSKVCLTVWLPVW